MMSVETIGSTEYCRIPSSEPRAAFWKAPLTSSAVTSRPSVTTKSVSEPVGTGARTATPSTFPLSSGSTSPIARAAPVDVGIRLIAAARAHESYVTGETLATSVSYDGGDGEAVTVDGRPLEIAVRRAQ